jgi:hypothetical protein
MQQRTAGEGAKRFLDADGRAALGPDGTIGPLYLDPPLEDFEIMFIDDTGDGTYEVGVRLIFVGGDFGHTYFVRKKGQELVISGGRSGLGGP